MKIEQMVPEDFMMREKMMDNIMLCSAQLQSAPMKMMARSSGVKKKSAGSFLGNITSSIAEGVTSFFSKKH